MDADLRHVARWPEAQLYDGRDQWNTERGCDEHPASGHGYGFDGTATNRDGKPHVDDYAISAGTTADAAVPIRAAVSTIIDHAHGTLHMSLRVLRLADFFFPSMAATRSLEPDPHWETTLIARVKGTSSGCIRSGLRT